ncbi:hypothetical protein HY57_08540 [Dyella japonica A8]|uniref:Uncharacterized protein n=1 Tax=Dyella japonica A8 TaxID=1217721 RepID=A0A075JYZ0_9GAMM|nr:hypothetical protein HY57_08540 [Dyella japonica A8]
MARKRKWHSSHVESARERAKRQRLARNSGSEAAILLAELEFCREYIPHELIQDEPELDSTAWIAYRYKNAFERTQQFTSDYAAIYVSVHGQYKDFAQAQRIKPVSEDLVRNARDEMTSLWKARQAADLLGMPYSMFIRASMKAAVDQRAYNRVPRPNQLCTSWQVEAAEKVWSDEQLIISIFADDWDPRFFAPQGRKDPARQAAIELLVARINARPPGNRAGALANYIHRRLALTEAEARDRFGDELVDEAMSARAAPTIELPREVGLPHRPACFGFRPEVPACTVCSVRDACEVLHARIDRTFFERVGNVDPQLVRTRQGNAERKRRQRAKQRAVLDVPPSSAAG